MNDNVEKVDLNRVDWKSSREFFESLGEALDKLEDKDESYDFTWVGKRKSIIEAGAPINKILRPDVEASRDFENTKNLYIEGDNLDALKLLQESYLGKVKMIYIDPPYNTGHDFVYHDNFTVKASEYQDNAIDEDGDQIISEDEFLENSKANGRFHSDWLSMIYPRLKVARNLLSDDGVIFISIDENEMVNARNICNEIFGEDNFVANLVWTNKEGGGSSDSRLFRIKHEYILCYAKSIDLLEIEGLPISNAERYKESDEYEQIRGKYYLQKLGMGSIQYSQSLDYPIETPEGFVTPAENNNGKKACWRWSRDKYERNKRDGFVVIKKDSKGVWTVYTKQYMNCDNDGKIINRTQRPMGIIDTYSSTQASKLLENLGLGNLFSYSKPVELIKYLINRVAHSDDDVILDFFSGSATTAHAVMQLNAEDGGNRQFIMVQLPEKTDEKSEANKAGYKNICEIGKERIRRAGDKIKAEHPEADIDTGFRVFRVDDSNENENIRKPLGEINQSDMFDMIDNVKKDRTPLDLLFGIIYTSALPFDLKLETRKIGENTVYMYGYLDENTGLVACFDDEVPEETVKEIAKLNPLTAAFKDSSFKNSAEKINLSEHFRIISPDTRVKVI